MRESLCHNAQWLRAMHITFVVAFAFLRVLSSLPSSFRPPGLRFAVYFPVSPCPSDRTIPIRAGLACPRIKAPISNQATQLALIQGNDFRFRKLHAYRTISRRVLSASSLPLLPPPVPLRTSYFSMAACRYRPGTSVLLLFKLFLGTACLLCSYAIIAPPTRV